MNDELLRETYDAWAESYDAANEMTDCEGVAVRSILRQLEFERVLDAATGTGRYALELARNGARVTAFDSNDRMLSVARGKAARQGIDVDFRRGDLRSLDWPQATFDLVLCAMSLAHLPEIDGVIDSFGKAMREQGHLVISDLHPELQADCGPDHYDLVAGEHRYFPQHHGRVEDYVDAIERAGLEFAMSVDVPFPLPPRGIIPGAVVLLARKPGRRR